MEKDNICLDGIGKKSECYCEIRRRLANNDHDFNMLTEFETFLAENGSFVVYCLKHLQTL